MFSRSLCCPSESQIKVAEMVETKGRRLLPSGGKSVSIRDFRILRMRRHKLIIVSTSPTNFNMADDGMLLNFEVPSAFTAPKTKFKGGSWKDRLTARKSAEYGRSKAAERANANVSTDDELSQYRSSCQPTSTIEEPHAGICLRFQHGRKALSKGHFALIGRLLSFQNVTLSRINFH